MDDLRSKDLVLTQLKVLLLQLAEKSDSPGADLHELLCQVIDELYGEVQSAMSPKSKIRLVGGSSGTQPN